MDDEAYVIHTDYNEIIEEVRGLRGVDEEKMREITSLVDSLKDLTSRLHPAIKKERYTQDEQQLWREYQQLQEEKLVLLDLSHEWHTLEKSVKGLSQNLTFLIKDAIEELTDHVEVAVETHRAHIDILEIQNTRRLSVNALIVLAVVSYLAAWEFSVREFLVSAEFPYGLSPTLNYVLIIVTLTPMFVGVLWAWLNRKSRLDDSNPS
jgi:hypothetical protein